MQLKDKVILETQFCHVFPSLKVRDVTSGKQAKCIILNSYEDIQSPCILKIFGKNKRLTKGEVGLLIREAKLYREDLLNAGVKIPINYKIFSLKDNKDHWRIFIIDEFIDCGGDLDVRLKDPRVPSKEKLRLARLIVDFILGLPPGATGLDTLVMGDFKPENFIEKDSKLVLIDYFNPKRRGSDGLVYPYLKKTNQLDQKAITFLCGDRRGEIGRFLALIQMSYPDISGSINNYAVTAFAENYPKISKWLKEEMAKEFQTIVSCYKVSK